MTQAESRRIGLVIGRESDWPNAFMDAINNQDKGITSELVKLGGTFMDSPCPFDLIIDRMSHTVPYYRVYLKYAALQGCYIVNNPFTWSADDKFLGIMVSGKFGLTRPRTVILPNKHLTQELGPDNFRNLTYPMDWQGIIDYVGVPAIFKDIHSGGRRTAYRVHNVDELIQRYDESGVNTMTLQQIIESDTHIHCFVIGQEFTLSLSYSFIDDKYEPEALSGEDGLGKQVAEMSLQLTRVFGYDINMVEFVVKNDNLYVINTTNPAPVIDLTLMTAEQFEQLTQATVKMAVSRIKRPLPQHLPFDIDKLP